jgi:D-serine deaminase-like pyridoxal phosphate-dependent protein
MAGSASAKRAAVLAEHCNLITVVDHLHGVDELAAAFEAAGVHLSVLCDVDVGLGRTGVVGPSQAVSVVDRIEQSPWLRFSGVQGYGGHLQHIVGREERRTATRESAHRLEVVIHALESKGYNVPLRTGGGTGTSMIDIEIGLLNELQPGSYVFMDRKYCDALGNDPEGRFQQSLTISTTVISTNQKDYVTVDAGLKASTEMSTGWLRAGGMAHSVEVIDWPSCHHIAILPSIDMTTYGSFEMKLLLVLLISPRGDVRSNPSS